MFDSSPLERKIFTITKRRLLSGLSEFVHISIMECARGLLIFLRTASIGCSSTKTMRPSSSAMMEES